VAHTAKNRNACTVLVDNLKDKDNLKDPNVYGRIILK
jgi:hypothetical protein